MIEAQGRSAIPHHQISVQAPPRKHDIVVEVPLPPVEITLRPITAADMEFLYQVYAGTRTEELAVTPWTEEQKQAFLQMQFDAQHTHYQKHFPEASFDVIEKSGRPVGRLYVDRRPAEIRVIDIALLQEERRGGIGGMLMQRILDEAGAGQKTVTIHVERNNPAMRLYERLGFARIEDQGVYRLMECRPSASTTPPS